MSDRREHDEPAKNGFSNGLLILHRWEYDYELYIHKCVEAPFGSVPSDRCPGCGVTVTDEQLCRFWGGEDPGITKSATLDYIANRDLLRKLSQRRASQPDPKVLVGDNE